MPENTLNILVVDDTVVYRRIVSDVVEAIDGATLAATAPNGKIALDKIGRIPVDLVLLDVEMPEMDGLETLKAIRRDFPDKGVIMVSGASRTSADITVKALQAGAIDFVPKPEGKNPQDSRRELIGQLTPLLQLFNTRRKLRGAAGSSTKLKSGRTFAKEIVADKSDPKPAPSPVVSLRAAPKPSCIDVVVIGVSTGGPNALAKIIPQLPGDLDKPVLIVQHMPPIFTKSLADSLSRQSAMDVREASDGERIEPNTVLIAPGGRHMVVRKKIDAASGQCHYCVALNDNPPDHHCRPSVNVMFRSIAAQYGGNMLAAVLTGMGDDGCEGVKAMKRQGCYCLTQTEDSCVVYGMPRAVDEAGLSDESVPLDELARRITDVVRNTAA